MGDFDRLQKSELDAGKKVIGCERHIAVDTGRRLLLVNLTIAEISDSATAQSILDGIGKRSPRIKLLFADAAYDRLKANYLDFNVEIIRRSDQQQVFKVLPQRWVLEQTFDWMLR